MNIKTRFAPSPTGIMHIGSVRTALYAYLVARHNKGTFTLRIEDTDQNRLVEGSVNDIIDSLKWLGLQFDEGPIYQSERKEVYEKYARELVSSGAAYEKDGAIWFKLPEDGKVIFTDIIGSRKIEFENSSQKDFVLLKSDGFPTYHLAHVVDDHLMETNPVIRAEEWLPSTPKHILLFKAFGWEAPDYAHIPLILGTDRSKLSKRHGAKGATEFRKDGFLAEAILNYMALLGWTPPSGKEILSLDEMIEEFDLKNVHIAPAVFDLTKLEWMNGEYIRKMSDMELTKRLQEFLVDHPAPEKIGPLVPLIKERIKTLADFVLLTNFITEEPEYDLSVFEKIKIVNQKQVLEKINEEMQKLGKDWKSDVFEKTFKDLATELDIKVGDMFQLIRIAVSGQSVTPPLFESIQILGEDEALKRVMNVAKKFPNF
ncbi:MAG: glutamate--tRNA ligase [Microgenomates group bacterium]